MPAVDDDFDLDPEFDLRFHHSFVTGVLGLMKRQCTHRSIESNHVRVNMQQCPNEAKTMVASREDKLEVDYLCIPCTIVVIERAKPDDVIIVQRLADRG